MMRLIIVLLVCLMAPGTWAQSKLLQAHVGAAPPSYTGPGDIVSGATFWGGLRAYSGAVAATGTQKSVNVRRASDNSAQDILILTSGALDTASALTFAGTDTSGNATSSGTSVALTGLASAAHVGSTITGSGFIGSYCVAVGSLVAGAQTVTTNTSQSIGVSEPVTLTWGLFVTKLYDQSGNARDASQATAANQPQLLLTGGTSSTLPTMVFTHGSVQYLQTGTISSVTQPHTYSVVYKRTTVAANSTVISSYNGSGSTVLLTGTSDIVDLYAGNTLGVAAVENTWHAVQAVANGINSVIRSDGTETAGDAGSSATFTAIGIGNDPNNAFGWALNGAISEAALWPVGFSPGNRTAVNSNQHSYWGF